MQNVKATFAWTVIYMYITPYIRVLDVRNNSDKRYHACVITTPEPPSLLVLMPCRVIYEVGQHGLKRVEEYKEEE